MKSSAASWVLGAALLLPVAAYADTANEGAAPRFDIMDFQIEGNTVLDDETLERAVYPFLGPDKTVSDVEKARAALENAYRQQGYATVMIAIPEQDVEADTVRLAVIEGAIETVHITGSRYYALGRIRQALPALTEGQVPNMAALQAQMDAAARQTSDRSVTPIFRAGATPGKMEVELRVKDELPLHGNVEMNSRGSEHTSYSRLLAGLRYNNLWQRFHSLALQYQAAPQLSDEVEVWSGTYVLPTGWADTQLALYAVDVDSNTQLGVDVGGLSVLGSGSIYGGRLMKPLSAIYGNSKQAVTLGVDYKKFEQQIGGLTASAPIAYLSFAAGYDLSVRGDTRFTGINIAGHFSVRGLGNDAEQFANKRTDAEPNFLYVTADLKHQQLLPFDFKLFARANGQASTGPLISNEQYAAGGPLSVRGYHQTQVLGDHGLNLGLELHGPSLFAQARDNVQNFRLLAFVDWATIRTMAPIAPTPSTVRLASFGAGLRAQWLKHILTEVDWSYPLYRQGSVDVGQQRIDFRMAYEF